MLNSRRSVLFMAAGVCGSGAASGAAGAASPLYARDGKGISAFLEACLAGRQGEIQDAIRQGIVLDIHEAAASGNKARVEEILSLNPGSVNHRDLQGATPLHYAAACGRLEMANVLLAKGAGLSLQAPGLGNAAPAHLAADLADAALACQLAQTIVGNGADVHARRSDGTTVLDLARRRGNQELIALLVRKGAGPPAGDAGADCYTGRYRGVEREDTYGIPQTWVNEFVTVSHFDPVRVKHLYGQCSDLLLTRSTWDEIGVEAAAHMGREEIAQFLLEKGSPLSLCTATMLGLTSEVKAILEEDRNRVRERGAHDFPVLWYTAFGKERAELAELLLNAGADPRAGMMGHTTRDLALKKGYHALLDVLGKHGA